MPPIIRRWRGAILAAAFMIYSLHYFNSRRNILNTDYIPFKARPHPVDGRIHWSKLPERYPVTSYTPLPTGISKNIPQIQAAAPKEDAAQKQERLKRLAAVKESFVHSWEGYKKNAWLRDEVTPISGAWRDTFGGWAATLVDSLDTLWIMGLKEDFELAVRAVEHIDFSTTDTKDINVFETTIRYMGGFLAAYDVSEGKYPALLLKAVEVADLLMSCFDTPNRMPISRWDWKRYMEGAAQVAPRRALVSEPGSLSLEFTRLSQLTGNMKYYDAVQRISDEFEKSQNSTRYPGMWPVGVDIQQLRFDEDTMFTMGGMSDSAYEYLPKQYMLLGGALEQSQKMYEKFIAVAKEKMFFSFLNPKNLKLKVSGDIRIRGKPEDKRAELIPRSQHLTCFTGGMVGIASRIFNRPEELQLAEELTNGCIWAYDSSANGVAPEIFTVVPCPDGDCTWSKQKWYDALYAAYPHGPHISTEETTTTVETIAHDRRLPPGFATIDDRKYILRPEAIESVFIMYRITGNRKYADAAWRMFKAVEGITRTSIAAAAVMDVTVPKEKVQQLDSMESFWLAETLKYFYLCFEEWDTVSLDEWVLNTEAHPLRRPGR
ncbi:putative class I alpha mannosidase protein [Rutstroemia sp. NJR-2017a WRK4]|nr:putative class I alpha mannosidase protein [Rutstroemia sp. NJR-2017a WRK4]